MVIQDSSAPAGDPDETDPDETDPDETDPDETDPDETDPDGALGFEPIEADTWHWQFSDEADVAVEAVAPSFESQQSAEEWLTESFESLLEQGVAAVTLFDGEGVVYGPMALAADDDAS